MMTYKIVFVLAAVVAVVFGNPLQSWTPEGYHYNKTEVTVIELAEPCARQGGICVRAEDCSDGDLAGIHTILCPEQHHLGVVCCYT